MGSSVFVQLAEIAASLALGVCRGFVYDSLRVFRRLFPFFVIVFDIIFCVFAAGCVFVLGMCCGGNLRFYMPFACVGGGAVYWITFGRLFRPIFDKLAGFLQKCLKALKKQGKKMIKNFKNIFSSAKKRFRITKYSKDGKLGIGMSNFKAWKVRQRGYENENSRSSHIAEVYYPCSFDICSSEHIRAEGGKRAGKRSFGRTSHKSRNA